ncbi:MAG: hypothetical protein QM747_03215 [Nocardioides sp.]
MTTTPQEPGDNPVPVDPDIDPNAAPDTTEPDTTQPDETQNPE